IEALRRSLGYASPNPVEDKDRSQHIGMLRMGIEPLERWAACSSLVRPEWIVQSLERPPPRHAPQLNLPGGKTLLKTRCLRNSSWLCFHKSESADTVMMTVFCSSSSRLRSTLRS